MNKDVKKQALVEITFLEFFLSVLQDESEDVKSYIPAMVSRVENLRKLLS